MHLAFSLMGQVSTNLLIAMPLTTATVTYAIYMHLRIVIIKGVLYVHLFFGCFVIMISNDFISTS